MSTSPENFKWLQDKRLFIPHPATPDLWREDFDKAALIMHYSPRGHPYHIRLTFEESKRQPIGARVPISELGKIDKGIRINIDPEIATSKTSRCFRVWCLSHEIAEIDLADSPVALGNIFLFGVLKEKFLVWQERRVNRVVFDKVGHLFPPALANKIVWQTVKEWKSLRSGNSTDVAVKAYIRKYLPFVDPSVAWVDWVM